MSSFIAIEGVEGSGKSTLIARLGRYFNDHGREVVLTREPGGTKLGIAIRQILLDRENTELCARAELLLFAADRAQHVSELIKPALKRGAVVLSDRFIHSTLAYQGFGRELSLELLKNLNQIATQGLCPDVVLLLDIDPQEGLLRVSGRSAYDHATSWNRFEDQELTFHQKVREGYLQLAADANERIAVLDASLSPNELETKAISVLKSRGIVSK